MTRTVSNWGRPPRKLRRPLTQRDNLALVPASELASLELWQERARNLPVGFTLVVVPSDNLSLRQVGLQLEQSLNARGRHLRLSTLSREA